MTTAMTGTQWLVRIAWIVEIVLGLIFWAGRALTLVPLHMLIGLLFVLGLWVLAVLAARRGVAVGLVVGSLVWGLVVLVFGMAQTSLLPGPTHGVIQVIHLLLGIGAIGLAEMLGARSRRATVAL